MFSRRDCAFLNARGKNENPPRGRKRNFMRTISRKAGAALGAVVSLALAAPGAFAGCGDLSTLRGPFLVVQAATALPQSTQAAVENAAADRNVISARSLVGMWSIQLISKGNANAPMPIPDGALVDFGYQIFHSDNTEWENSGGRSPNTQNFCEGVWGQTGFNTYELNHFAYQYDPSTEDLTGTANIRYQLTVSPSGDSFTGTFTIDIYDTKANHLAHITGTLSATRVTVDTGVTAIP